MPLVVNLELFNHATLRGLNEALAGVEQLCPPGKSFGRFPETTWCAEITGISGRYRFERKFLDRKVDYSQANSRGTRGVYAVYILWEGKIYEISEQLSWKRSTRGFWRVVNGARVSMNESEVEACFAK